MESFEFSKRLSCEMVRDLLRNFAFETLDDVEQKGRVQGHLLSCDTCAPAYDALVEEAMASGAIPVPEIPESPLLPEFLLYPAEQAKSKVGIIWELANTWKNRLTADTRKVYDKVERQLNDFAYILAAGEKVAGMVIPGPNLGQAKLGEQRVEEPQTARIKFVDPEWNEVRDEKDEFLDSQLFEGPIITSTGEFRTTLQIQDEHKRHKYEGQQVVCSLELVEKGRVGFLSSFKHGKARFRATGLPASDVDRVLNMQRLDFYLQLPRTQ